MDKIIAGYIDSITKEFDNFLGKDVRSSTDVILSFRIDDIKIAKISAHVARTGMYMSVIIDGFGCGRRIPLHIPQSKRLIKATFKRILQCVRDSEIEVVFTNVCTRVRKKKYKN